MVIKSVGFGDMDSSIDIDRHLYGVK